MFLITFLLMLACCGATYSCIVHFAPYVYTHELSDAEELAELLALELSCAQEIEAPRLLSFYEDLLSREFDDEFVFRLFRPSGEEVALPRLDATTGAHLADYAGLETGGARKLSFADSMDAYTLLLAKNTGKESQVVQALQKALPLLGVFVFLLSLVAAFFYSWYMTAPVKAVSRVARQMAALDFSGLCPVRRTDEIGVLSESLNTLSQRLDAALSDLRAANRQLQADIERERQLERQRADFFSAASHELKTPITIVKGQLEGMLCRVGRYKDRETYLAQSLEVTGTLEAMVQELLTLSRLETPGYVFRPCRLDLSGLLRDRLTAHEDLFARKELTVEASIVPEAYVQGDAQLLQKAVDNLLGNAAAYSEGGNRAIVKLWEEPGHVHLTVENTGAHIPEDDMPRLFEAFYRVDPSRSRQTGGAGLGLYIVKTILDLHGAQIEMANTSQGVIASVRF